MRKRPSEGGAEPEHGPKQFRPSQPPEGSLLPERGWGKWATSSHATQMLVITYIFYILFLSSPGYGHMAPLSAGGKAFCVLYTALGLPASLALVAALRRCLLPLLSRQGAWVPMHWQLTPARAALLQAAGLGLLVAGTFVLLPALVLWSLQGDCSLLEAIYFCFGSLSTIGLGDLLPGRGRGLHPVLYRLGQFALLGESSCQGA